MAGSLSEWPDRTPRKNPTITALTPPFIAFLSAQAEGRTWDLFGFSFIFSH